MSFGTTLRSRGTVIVLLVLAMTTTCAKEQRSGIVETNQPTAKLVYPGNDWQRRTPAEAGLNEQHLRQIAAYLDGRGIITKDGYEVFTWGDATMAADVASAVKPLFTHFLLEAVENERITGFDDRLAAYQPQLAQLNESLEYKDKLISFRHCANQVSCYGVREKPGSAYDYNDFQMALFVDTLFTKVYGTPWEDVDAKLLAPMLSEPLQLQDAPSFLAFGRGDRPGRLKISPRDFCRFGLLYLRQGRWNGQQLISPRHARMVTRSPVPLSVPRTTAQVAEMLPGQRSIGSTDIPDDQTDHFGSYSWLWWMNGIRKSGARLFPEAPVDVFACLGHKHGKRGMAVIPQWNIVMSWNDSSLDGQAWADPQTDPHPLNEVFRLLKKAQSTTTSHP